MHETRSFYVKDLEKRFGEFVLQVKELALERGYVMGLVGPNGAGKSTFIKILLNLVYPDRGRVSVLGLEHPKDEREIKRRVGYVSENPSFYDEMTVGWTLRFTSRYYPGWSDAKCRDYLSRFELDAKKRVKELSKGMKVKLALTIALSHDPELLIMDEPTSGLDPVARRELLAEIMDVMREHDRSVIFSSHISQDVQQVADYVTILNGGAVIEHADKEQLFARWRKVTGKTRPSSAESPPGFVTYKVQDGRFLGVTNRYSPEWIARLRGQGASHLETVPMDLDEILISAVGKEL